MPETSPVATEYRELNPFWQWHKLVLPAGFEPASDCLKGIVVSQLVDGSITIYKLVRRVGVEPTRIVWLRASCPSTVASDALLTQIGRRGEF